MIVAHRGGKGTIQRCKQWARFHSLTPVNGALPVQCCEYYLIIRCLPTYDVDIIGPVALQLVDPATLSLRHPLPQVHRDRTLVHF